MDNPLAGRRWRGRWIWPATAPIELDAEAAPVIDHAAARSWVCLRKTFRVTAVPPAVPARFTADSRYVLWLNGVEIARGPVRGNPGRLHFDTADLAGHLVAGDNTITILARHYGAPMPWWMPVYPTYGLGGGAFVLEAKIGSGASGWLVSDGSWRGVVCDAWDDGDPSGQDIGGLTPGRPERFDARLLAVNWNQPEFDDRAWSPVVELKTNHVGWDGDHHPPNHPYGPLLPRPIPPLSGDTKVASVASAGAVKGSPPVDDPIDQVAGDFEAAPGLRPVLGHRLPVKVELTGEFDAGLLVLDFGEQVSGLLSIELDANEGTTLDARVAEAVDNSGALQPLQQRNGFRYTTRGSDDSFETFDPVGLRYLGLSLRGSGSVTIKSARVREQLFPRPSGPFFECSDDTLNEIWAIGRRTVDLCSHDAYLDCPSREQRAWTGDAVVHQLVDLTTNPDWSLARWNQELGASPRPDGMLPMAAGGDFEYADSTYIPDWALHWIHGLYNLARYTGDEDYIRALLPVAERILQWFLPFQADDGLLTNVTGWVLIDWSAVSTGGKCATLNALWGRALREVQKLADQVGDGGRARWAGKLWVRLRRDFEQFWDDDRAVFVDNLPERGRPDNLAELPVSQHANAAAITARLTRGIDTSKLIETICDRDRLVHAAWLAPNKDARLHSMSDPGDMYEGFAYLVSGTPEPWWDVKNAIVAAQPFFRYVVHDAAADAERADLIPELCRDWAALMHRSSTTWSETWYGGSHTHGWCSTPTRDLMQYTLGITPAQPGFNRAHVAPALGDLSWAKGEVPTPHGPIRVDVETDKLALDTPVEAVVVFGGIDTRVQPGHHEFASPPRAERA
ncbi:MAG: family 78 glycoside hydrolase catalytic domain [Actinobacteria bacterium]|nr:family 78 glycoside hydrolase catalytic domain [Actinomycetota bacterium]